MNSTIAEILLVVTALAAGFAFIKFGKVIAGKVDDMSSHVSNAVETALNGDTDKAGAGAGH